MANPQKPQDDGQVKNPAKSPLPHGAAIEQGNIEISKEDLDKVTGGGTQAGSNTGGGGKVVIY
jgi:hypothetical protein